MLKAHQQSGRMPDETLEAISDKATSALSCEPCDSKPLTASTADVSDVGIQEFLFQPSEELVILHLSQPRVSSTFSADLFKVGRETFYLQFFLQINFMDALLEIHFVS